jgi:hypothetical protein
MDFGPGLKLRRRAATLGQHLRLLLPARAYIYRKEGLHKDANPRFILRFLIKQSQTTNDNHGVHGGPHSPR